LECLLPSKFVDRYPWYGTKVRIPVETQNFRKEVILEKCQQEYAIEKLDGLKLIPKYDCSIA
jgi:hypothetical protein